MPAYDRVVYGRAYKPTPAWLWIAQRASGVLLGPLVLIHIWSDKTAASAALNALLLVVILVHGYSGLRRIVVTRNRFGAALALTLIWCVVVAGFGTLLVLRP